MPPHTFALNITTPTSVGRLGMAIDAIATIGFHSYIFRLPVEMIDTFDITKVVCLNSFNLYINYACAKIILQIYLTFQTTDK